MKMIISWIAAFLLFGLIFIPLLHKTTRAVVSPYTKANARKRMAAAAIDALICASILAVGILQKSMLAIGMAAAFVLARDVIFEGRSPGKKIAGLLVVRLQDGKPCRLPQSIVRDFLFIIPGMNLVALGVEIYLIFKDKQGMRLGDRLARTQVIEGKELPEVAKWFQFILDYFQKIAADEQLQNEPARSGDKLT